MNIQTIAQAMALLELIQQPAFCLHSDGRIFPNRSAESIAPVSGQALPQWLGESAEAYTLWDRTTRLVLPAIEGLRLQQVRGCSSSTATMSCSRNWCSNT